MRRRAEEPYVQRPHPVHAHHDQFHVFSRRDRQDLAIGLPGGDAFIGSAPHASFVGQPPFLPTTSCAPAAEKIVSFTSLLKRTTQAPDSVPGVVRCRRFQSSSSTRGCCAIVPAIDLGGVHLVGSRRRRRRDRRRPRCVSCAGETTSRRLVAQNLVLDQDWLLAHAARHARHVLFSLPVRLDDRRRQPVWRHDV